jgi:arginase
VKDDLSLLLPEWQGYGLDASVAHGARAIAALFPPEAFVEVEAPDTESLAVEGGVLGLSSIAARLGPALNAIRTRQPPRIFTIGGTCGVELGPVSYLNDRYRGDLAVVWLDAHADLNTPQSSPSGRFHGMVLRTLLGDGPPALVSQLPRTLVPTQVVLAGARDLDRPEAEFASDAAIARFSPADLLVPDRIAGRIRAAGFTKVYIHLDLDVIDPIEFPDSLVHASGGISMDTAVDAVRSLASTFDAVGFSVVECRPRSADAPHRVRRLLDRCGIQIGALERT